MCAYSALQRTHSPQPHVCRLLLDLLLHQHSQPIQGEPVGIRVPAGAARPAAAAAAAALLLLGAPPVGLALQLADQLLGQKQFSGESDEAAEAAQQRQHSRAGSAASACRARAGGAPGMRPSRCCVLGGDARGEPQTEQYGID